jgi:hypothetical protein
MQKFLQEKAVEATQQKEEKMIRLFKSAVCLEVPKMTIFSVVYKAGGGFVCQKC